GLGWRRPSSFSMSDLSEELRMPASGRPKMPSVSRRHACSIAFAALIGACGCSERGGGGDLTNVTAGLGIANPSVVISQLYGGGGNSLAPLRNDFMELFNRSAGTVSLAGWSVQYASATGTGNFASNPVVA